MRTTQKFLWFLVVAVSMLATACATTKFTGVWKDVTYVGYPTKIMVICASSTLGARRVLEDEFVKELNGRGIDSIASYPMLPDLTVTDKSAIITKAGEVGADTVLVTKTVGRKTVPREGVQTTFTDEYIITETDMYDMKSSKQIWVATSETWVTGNEPANARLQSFVRAIIGKLAKEHLIIAKSSASTMQPY